MQKYHYNKKAGAVQEVLLAGDAEPPLQQRAQLSAPMGGGGMRPSSPAAQSVPSASAMLAPEAPPQAFDLTFEPERKSRGAMRRSPSNDGTSMFFTTVREGQRVLVTHRSGRGEIVEGPSRIWRWGKRIEPLTHYVAHPGEFLVVRFRSGAQEHLVGPAHHWLDPREHLSVTREEAVQIAAKEAVVVYTEGSTGVSRRVVHGPATFAPQPGEWLHDFSWHGPAANAVGFQKVPGAMNFQKLWLLPDQMYHDVVDVRTADDAVLTIRLMLFFELVDIERMLATTHDPIGDFVNAATSDVVDFVGKRAFDDFKSNTGSLNDLQTYGQLTARASQCGYRIDKVVYRGYGAPPALQRLHDEATESRVRLQLQRATEQQAQELEDFKQDRSLGRAEKARAQRQADAAVEGTLRADRERLERAHLAELAALGVDLTALLTSGRPDRIVEVRGPEGTHLHLRE